MSFWLQKIIRKKNQNTLLYYEGFVDYNMSSNRPLMELVCNASFERDIHECIQKWHVLLEEILKIAGNYNKMQ